MDELIRLRELICHIQNQQNVSYQQFEAIAWQKLIERNPRFNDLWLAIRRFCDDEDIRASDIDYDTALRESIRCSCEYINESGGIKL